MLPSSPSPPPDVTAEVRAALSESEPTPRPAEVAAESQPKRPPLRTGIYRRPERLPLARQEPPKAPANERRRTPWAWLRDWFDGVELDRRLVSLVVVLVMMVSSITYWAFSPRKEKPAPPPAVDLREIYRHNPRKNTPPALLPSRTARSCGESGATAPALTTADWKMPAGSDPVGQRSVAIWGPVFVSLANISVEHACVEGCGRPAEKLENGADCRDRLHQQCAAQRPPPNSEQCRYCGGSRANAREHLEVFMRPARAGIFRRRQSRASAFPMTRPKTGIKPNHHPSHHPEPIRAGGNQEFRGRRICF